MTTFPKTFEHSKNYLVNIQVFGDKVLESEPVELNYIATSFDINYSGGSDFVHQKGRKTASVFAMQPAVSISIRCYMSEPDFSVIVSNIITNQQHILMKVGKLRETIRYADIISEKIVSQRDTVEGGTETISREHIREIDPLVDPSATIYEIVGYMKDARITATAGEFIVVDLTVNADDINEFNYNDLPTFEP